MVLLVVGWVFVVGYVGFLGQQCVVIQCGEVVQCFVVDGLFVVVEYGVQCFFEVDEVNFDWYDVYGCCWIELYFSGVFGFVFESGDVDVVQVGQIDVFDELIFD